MYLLDAQQNIRTLVDPSQTGQSGLPDTSLLVLAVLVTGAFFTWLTRRSLKDDHVPLRAPTPLFAVSLRGLLIAIGVFFVAHFVGTALGMFAVGYTPGSGDPTPLQRHQIKIILAVALLLTPFALTSFTRSELGGKVDVFSLSTIGKRGVWLPLLFFAWLLLSLSVAWLARSLQSSFGLSEAPQEVLASLTAESPWRIPAAIASAVLAAPIAEEFAFRAGIFGGLRRYMGFLPSALITTVFFAVVHNPSGEPQFILPITVLSLALCWSYECGKNIWFPIALHAFHNGATLALIFIL